MSVRELVTLSFAKNVGGLDRALRVASGAGIAAVGWAFGLGLGLAVPLTVLGLMWVATGVLSKCTIYYLLGFSTCPARARAER